MSALLGVAGFVLGYAVGRVTSGSIAPAKPRAQQPVPALRETPLWCEACGARHAIYRTQPVAAGSYYFMCGRCTEESGDENAVPIALKD